MAVATVLEWHLTGGINGTTNVNPFLSLGGQMAAKILDDKLENLFDPVSGNDQLKGITNYRWVVMLNAGGETFRNPHFYFLPKDDNVDIEFSRLSISAPVSILPTEEDRPSEEEIGPEVDVPMPFEKSTEAYETTLSIAPDVPPGGKLYICFRRVIPAESPSENRAFRLIAESRIPQQSATSTGQVVSEGGEGTASSSTYPGR